VTPTELRESIPALDEVAYLNTGASGPATRPVLDAATGAIEEFETAVHADGTPYKTAFERYEEFRESVAAFLGVAPSTIALVGSTADAINRYILAYDWEPGDTVVRMDFEHPAGILPYDRLARHGVEVRVPTSEAGHLDREAYADAVEDADLVSFSAITWNYGTRLPVSDLVDEAHDAGATVLVDAVQAVGQGPIDLTEWGADAVAFAGHKWLLGPWGAGVLYVPEDTANGLEPAAIGYRSVTDPPAEGYTLKSGAPRFEVGTANLAPYAGTVEGMATLDEIGLDAVRDRIERLTQRFKSNLPDHRLLSPAGFESGLVTVDVGDPGPVVDALGDRGLVVRDVPFPEALRVSIHAFNTAEDVDRVAEALDDVAW
jgi:cysteine desulfurase/selenocysteine lyase